jgi:choline dehydrogenase-like flavoprotein
VDSRLNVREIHGLRVCDASVLPSTISGPTALTCAGVGLVCASILIGNDEKKNL